jgi:hypothetical protein
MLILAELWGWQSDSQEAPEIRFTLDGIDPRSPEALLYEGVVTVGETMHLKARARAPTEWSALSEAYFVVRDAIPLRITEILYHPASSPELPFDEEEFEFLEILNVGNAPVPLASIRLEGGIAYDFTGSAVPELLPGEYLLVVKNLQAFHARYGESGFLIAGQYEGRLSNDGDQVILKGPLGETLLEVRYRDDWQPSTDGEGYSLTIADPAGPAEDWPLPESWKASRAQGGSPGAPDDGNTALGGWQRPGDSNGDGKLDLSDGLSILLRLFAGASQPLPCESGDSAAAGNRAVLDLNSDQLFDVSDAIYLLHHLFRGGPSPAAGSRCGRIPGCRDSCIP